MMAKGIFIAENMASTKLGSLLRSARQSTAIENGSVVGLGDLVEGEQELYNSIGVAANTDAIYFVDGVELVASQELTKGLDDFENVADKAFRVRKPMAGDRFSISESMITALATDVVEGNVIETPTSGNKIAEAETATVDASFVGKIVKRWILGTRAIPMVRVEVVQA